MFCSVSLSLWLDSVWLSLLHFLSPGKDMEWCRGIRFNKNYYSFIYTVSMLRNTFPLNVQLLKNEKCLQQSGQDLIMEQGHRFKIKSSNDNFTLTTKLSLLNWGILMWVYVIALQDLLYVEHFVYLYVSLAFNIICNTMLLSVFSLSHLIIYDVCKKTLLYSSLFLTFFFFSVLPTQNFIFMSLCLALFL